MDVYMLRHGDCSTDGVRRYVGQINYPLSAKGREQARRWQEFFAGHRPDRIVCSDLLRTVQTVEEVFWPSPVLPVLDPAFREISMGSWEGVEQKEIRNNFPHAYEARGADFAGFAAPGGECFADVQARVVAAFERVCGNSLSTDTLLIVTHAGVIRTLLCHILGMSLQQMFLLGQEYAGCTHLVHKKGAWMIRSMNVCVPCA